MLALPTKGVVRSIRTHNCDLSIFCDWIEANITFYCEELTIIDVADELLSHEVYVDQDFVREFISTCWDELLFRTKAYGIESTFSVHKARLQRVAVWEETPGYAFCLLLSLAPNYDWWKEASYNEQGMLFEELSNDSILSILDFKTYPTGWSSDNTKCFREHVVEICTQLNFGGGDVDKWDGSNKKEYGLDILAYYDFGDNRTGAPYYMFQCASGQNWRAKLQTPDLKIWREVLNPSVQPCRGFAIPFCLEIQEFERTCTKVGGVMLDRSRILGASKSCVSWLNDTLKDKLKAWCAPRVNWVLSGSMI